MEQEIQAVASLVNAAAEFAVAYGLQILGALVILAVGLKVAGWTGNRVIALCRRREIDVTLARFLGNVVKILLVAVVVIITLSNFGIDIAPLVALAGAAAFGVSFAVQGPLSNYGAGLVIILTRPFTVGDTIEVQGVSGVVEEVTLSATTLLGEDKERILIPNRKIVGEILVNSDTRRIVEAEIVIDARSDPQHAVEVVRAAIGSIPEVAGEGEDTEPQVGIHDFSVGGVVIGLRYWAPSTRYYRTRYAVNAAAYSALGEAGISLLPAGRAAIVTDIASG